jgi:uncharacterized glyoxalase superfamily protein PhnB
LQQEARVAAALILMAATPAPAQLADANSLGVAMGQLHYLVDDVAAHRDFWVALGGESVPFPSGEIVKMPGVLILISEAEAEAEAVASLVDHVAFRVASLAALEARGFELEHIEAYPGIASIYTPSGDRVELFEEGTATNVGFTPDVANDAAERHNRPLVGAIDSHHLHFYLPEGEVLAARDWYVEHFGAVPGTRWRYAAADLPGMNLNFSATNPARAATSGRSLDHIGFEIGELEAFCAELEARGIEFDMPFRRLSPGSAVAILTDPWGTTLELSEGLSDH